MGKQKGFVGPSKKSQTGAGGKNSTTGGGGKPLPEMPPSKLSVLQQQFAKKLEGSRFRVINEQLYTSTGKDSFAKFQSEPALFNVYHQGFREQASRWPHNPLDSIIAWIRSKYPRAVVADLGCGDARLSVSLTPHNRVYSFDLVAPVPNPRGIVACDIAKVPLADSSMDVAVFCLALMGTNIVDFLSEAHRILRPGGVLKIAEVRSRFESRESGGCAASEGVKKFLRLLKRSGFALSGDPTGEGNVKVHNEMFFEIEATKLKGLKDGHDKGTSFSAKPCIYKRR